MKISNTTSPSFGWNIKTHYLLTKLAASQFPNLRKYSGLLARSSMMPDINLSQTSFGYKEAHCFFGKNFNAMDLVPQNASDFYCDLTSKALHFMQFRECFLTNHVSMKKAGNALHFLQDIAVPLHTKESAQKFSKIFSHIKYENIAKNNPSMIDDIAYRTSPAPNTTFTDCFMDTYKKSSSMKNPFEIPKKEWEDSVRESLTNAYEHTLQFLSKISALKEVPQSERADSYFQEIVPFFPRILKSNSNSSIFKCLYCND